MIPHCFSVWLLFALVSSSHGAWNISREEDVELEKQLKILNQPAVETIYVDNGDIFDCVDINKQPSLHHPLLKNHKVKMAPESVPKSSSDEFSDLRDSSITFGLKTGCPPGTVPIRRTRKEDLIRAKRLSKLYAEEHVSNTMTRISAEMHTDIRPGLNYFGAQAFLNVYNPTVLDKQHSGATVEIYGYGDDGRTSVVKAGWAVSPALYGDNRTRFHTYWSNDNARGGCFDNRLCPGFVHVNPQLPLGAEITPVSVFQGNQADIKIIISKEESSNGDWWLYVSESRTPIGYWPKSLFGNLGNSGNCVKWGGMVYSPEWPFGVPYPQMGSGHSPSEGGFKCSCYIRTIQVQNQLGGTFVDVSSDNMFAGQDQPRCYTVGPLVFYGNKGYAFYFGGPGGQGCGN